MNVEISQLIGYRSHSRAEPAPAQAWGGNLQPSIYPGWYLI
jgi:hypothetical protein